LSEKKELWELVQMAKWSHSLREKKIAIKELSFHEELAIPYLDEVMDVTTYDEIKAACIEAIKAVKEKNQIRNQLQQETDTESGPTSRLADLPLNFECQY
jgi:hypothetical protein